MELTNLGARTVHIDWIDHQGVAHPYRRLCPGHTFEVQTYDSHVFRVRAESGESLQAFVAKAGDCRGVID